MYIYERDSANITRLQNEYLTNISAVIVKKTVCPKYTDGIIKHARNKVYKGYVSFFHSSMNTNMT